MEKELVNESYTFKLITKENPEFKQNLIDNKS